MVQKLIIDLSVLYTQIDNSMNNQVTTLSLHY